MSTASRLFPMCVSSLHGNAMRFNEFDFIVIVNCNFLSGVRPSECHTPPRMLLSSWGRETITITLTLRRRGQEVPRRFYTFYVDQKIRWQINNQHAHICMRAHVFEACKSILKLHYHVQRPVKTIESGILMRCIYSRPNSMSCWIIFQVERSTCSHVDHQIALISMHLSR